MERISYNSIKIKEFIDSLSPKNSGIIFSILLHLIILLSAVGLPNFFGPKDIYIPNVIPIEILNVSDVTNIEKSESNTFQNKQVEQKQKKFNSSENSEVKKQVQTSDNFTKNDDNKPEIQIKEKVNVQIEQKKIKEVTQKINPEIKTNLETIKTNEIKPKLKPKAKKIENKITKSDIQIEPKAKKEIEIDKKNFETKPKSKPKEDFNIASMLKDLRNEKSNNALKKEVEEENTSQTGKNQENENMILSISEIDLLRQQLSSCWNAPAGAVIERGMKVTISANVRQNMKVLDNSIRIIDTNISKSNPFYGPITDSAMRTLLNPECTPLKLPSEKYNLWKNLTITFDYSIMKGY
tara:strand:+ start:109 stop:1164 length:1056 start_codon:yes stop_codon:yes gene_type:complete